MVYDIPMLVITVDLCDVPPPLRQTCMFLLIPAAASPHAPVCFKKCLVITCMQS